MEHELFESSMSRFFVCLCPHSSSVHVLGSAMSTGDSTMDQNEKAACLHRMVLTCWLRARTLHLHLALPLVVVKQLHLLGALLYNERNTVHCHVELLEDTEIQ